MYITDRAGNIHFIEENEMKFQRIQGQSNGDNWGNGNIRFCQNQITVKDALMGISPTTEKHAIGAICDGKKISLQEFLKRDCTLIPLTIDDLAGRVIIHQTLLMISGLSVYQQYKKICFLEKWAVDENGFYMEWITSQSERIDLFKIKEEIRAYCKETVPIYIHKNWQKGLLEEMYPALKEGYSQPCAGNIDDFDEISVASCEDWAMPIGSETVYLPNTRVPVEIWFNVQQHGMYLKIEGGIEDYATRK